MKSQFLPPRCQQQEQKALVEEGPGHLAGLEKGTGDCVSHTSVTCTQAIWVFPVC